MRISVSFISVVCLLILSVSCSYPTAPGFRPQEAGPGEIALLEEFFGVSKSILEAGDKTPEGVVSDKHLFFGFGADDNAVFSELDGYHLTGKGGSQGFSGRLTLLREFLHAAVEKNGKILLIREFPVKGEAVTFNVNGVRYRYRIPHDSSYTPLTPPKTAKIRWYKDLAFTELVTEE